jgi:BirA family biotin operon repressor/biotin-[acetyl-CoA-carboxylase] ligase
MDQELLKKALQGTPVSDLRVFDEIGSTNDEALAWLEGGARDFALVIAESQSKGRGRFTRKWVTLPGTSLAFTVVLRPNPQVKDENISLYAPLCGVAVHSALRKQCGLKSQIKWPNDVLLNREKCCGILVEADWTGSTLNGIVAGIGINIGEGSLPPESLFPATWIEKHTKERVDRYQLLAVILNELVDWRPRIGSAAFFEAWSENLAFTGESVRIEQESKAPITGTEVGIDGRGNLLLVDATGATITVEVGDVHLRSNQ